MAKKRREARDTSKPGDHLVDCLFAPKAALRRAGRRTIPFLETAAVAAVGLLGLGWSVSGLLFGGETAFERAVLGGLVGLGSVVLVALFTAAANALQAGGSGPAVTFKQSAAIVASGLVAPSVVTVATGVAALTVPLFVESDLTATLPALLGVGVWTAGLIGMTGVGHATARNVSGAIGVASALGAALVVAFVAGLAGFVLQDPFWADEQPWGFL